MYTERGEYNLAWNEVMLPDSDDTVSYILHHIFIVKHVIFRHELFYAVECFLFFIKTNCLLSVYVEELKQSLL
jgi:hypothetical protein